MSALCRSQLIIRDLLKCGLKCYHQSSRHMVFVADETENNTLTLLKTQVQINVRQKEEWLEIITGYETNNKYDILNTDKKLLFKALENTSTWFRLRYGRKRPYIVELWDNNGIKQMVMKSYISPEGKKLNIEIPPDTLFATITEEMVFLQPSFFIRDAAGISMFRITSPLSASTGSFKNVNFEIYRHDPEVYENEDDDEETKKEKTNIGHITKKWSGLLREYYTDADFFELIMPEDLSVEWKTVLLAATLMVDFEFYEKRTRGIIMRTFFWWAP